MKKSINVIICFFLIVSMCACRGKVSEVKTHEVESLMYSRDEIISAIDVIKEEFEKDWKGCTLTEIYYAGDETTKDFQDWADRNNADEVIVLLSSFDTDHFGVYDSLNSDSTYDNWMWILVRTNGGTWQHADHGY